MRCIVEFSEPLVRFDFCANRYKQKIWIDAMLKYGKLDMTGLASLLDVSTKNLRKANSFKDERLGMPKLSTLLDTPTKTLEAVHNGTKFLDREQAENLGKLFLVCFAD